MKFSKTRHRIAVNLEANSLQYLLPTTGPCRKDYLLLGRHQLEQGSHCSKMSIFSVLHSNSVSMREWPLILV